MIKKNSDLHGYVKRTCLRKVAKHEAGHAFMLWLLDQNIGGACACDEGGITRRVIIGKDSLVLPSQHLLYLLAGMIMAGDKEVLFELRDHANTPEYFDTRSDSFLAATLAHAFDAPPLVVFINHEIAITRFRQRINRPFNEIFQLLLQNENHVLDFKVLYEMSRKWDMEYGFDKRPKSDYVMRTLARIFQWKVPKCKWIGWDMAPLVSWVYEPPTLVEVAQKIKEEMDAGNV